jgi:hypothetical protein
MAVVVQMAEHPVAVVVRVLRVLMGQFLLLAQVAQV